MTLAFDSLQRRTIQEVLEWYGFQVEVLGREKTRVFEALHTGGMPSDSRFFGMAGGEIDEFFNLHCNELDFVVMLDLMSAAEAAIRVDYQDRVDRRLKDAVSRKFREIDKRLSKNKRPDRVRLEEHILDTWASLVHQAKPPVGHFKGALKLRDWLAHGRHWDPRLGRQQYSPADVYDISSDLLDAMK
jgi:hypothetical protein